MFPKKVETPFLIKRNGLVSETMALDLLRTVKQMVLDGTTRNLMEVQYPEGKLTALIRTDSLPVSRRRIKEALRFTARVENLMNEGRKRGVVTIYVDKDLIRTVDIETLGLVSMRALETA